MVFAYGKDLYAYIIYANFTYVKHSNMFVKIIIFTHVKEYCVWFFFFSFFDIFNQFLNIYKDLIYTELHILSFTSFMKIEWFGYNKISKGG